MGDFNVDVKEANFFFVLQSIQIKIAEQIIHLLRCIDLLLINSGKSLQSNLA